MKIQKKLISLIPSKAMLAAMLATTLIGISPCFVKITDIGPNATGFFRMLFSLFFLVLLTATQKNVRSYETLSGGEPKFLVVLSGLFLSLDLACWHVSLHYTEIVNAALFNNMMPVFMPLLVWIFYSQRPNWRFLIAVTFAMLGAAIVTGESMSMMLSSFTGDMLAMLAAVFYACYIMVVTRLRKFMPVTRVMAWTTFFCGLFMLLYAVLSGEKIMLTTKNDWIGTLSLALLVQTGGQGLLAYAMGYLSETMISIMVLFSTVVSGIAGWIFFGEELGFIQFAGGAIVISSIIYANYVETLTQRKIANETTS